MSVSAISIGVSDPYLELFVWGLESGGLAELVQNYSNIFLNIVAEY